MDRRNFILSLLATGGLQGCGNTYPADFSLEWDEEVELHDRRRIVVHIRRYFWRGNQRVEWPALYMGTEISFDMGHPRGLFKRDFKGYQVILIDQKGTDWYLEIVKTGAGIGPRPPLVDERYPYLILHADGSESAASSPEDLPREFVPNIRMLTDDFGQMSKLNKQLLRWSEKSELLQYQKNRS